MVTSSVTHLKNVVFLFTFAAGSSEVLDFLYFLFAASTIFYLNKSIKEKWIVKPKKVGNWTFSIGIQKIQPSFECLEA